MSIFAYSGIQMNIKHLNCFKFGYAPIKLTYDSSALITTKKFYLQVGILICFMILYVGIKYMFNYNKFLAAAFCTVWLYVHYYPPGCEIVLPYGRGLDPLDYITPGGFLFGSYPHGREGYLGVGFPFSVRPSMSGTPVGIF